MSFEAGPLSLLICPLRNPLPEDFLARFAANSGGRLDDVKDEPVLGWVSGRHLLESEINESTCICGGHVSMNLRKVERKIPPQLLNAMCRRDELAWSLANDQPIVPRKKRKEIKEEAIERMLPKMPPTISATAFAIDRTRNILYFAGTSLAQFDAFVVEFTRALGMDCEPVPVSVEEWMLELFQKSANDLPDISFTDKKGAGDEPQPGRDFLTWLWFETEQNGGRLHHDEFGDFVLSLEGPLTLAFSPGKTKDPELAGSGESVIKKGNPMLSAEAKASLSGGKKLRKAKLMLARGDADKWTFSFDADTFAFNGLSLPEGEEMELNARFEERIFLINILYEVMKAYFRRFVESVSGDRLTETQAALRQWVKDRESL